MEAAGASFPFSLEPFRKVLCSLLSLKSSEGIENKRGHATTAGLDFLDPPSLETCCKKPCETFGYILTFLLKKMKETVTDTCML